MPETFSPITWHNDAAPALNESNLNRLEVGVEVLDDRITTLENGVVTPVIVPFATSVTLNATQGSLFRCVASGDLTLDDIIGGSDGQAVVVEIQAAGTARALHFTGSTEVVTIPVGQWWVGTFRYVAAGSLWLLTDNSGGGGGGGGGNDLNVLAPIVVPYAATVTLDAATGALFRITAPGNFTLNSPINGTDGQAVVVEVLATGASRTVSFAAGYPAVTIPTNTRWSGTLRYDAGAGIWLLASTSTAASAVSSINGLTGAVVLTADNVSDGSAKVLMTPAERTKLAGVATGATAYADEQAQDAAAAMITSGTHTGITASYVDASNRIDLTVTGGGGGGYTTVQDEGTARTARATLNFVGAGVTVTDDAANTRTLVTIPGGVGGSAYVFSADNSGATDVSAALVTQATAATTAGQPLLLPPGTYLMTNAPTTMPDNVTIWSPTRGATFISNKTGPQLWVTNGMTLKGLTFRNNGTTNPPGNLSFLIGCQNVLIEDCRFEGDQASGFCQGVVVNNSGCKDITIRRCSFDGHFYGVLTNTGANDLTGLTVENCVFTEQYGDAIEINHPSATAPVVSGIRISNNKMLMPAYTGAGSGSGFAVGIAGARDISIVGNTITGARREALHIEDDCHAIAISGNTIKNVDNTGGSGATAGVAIYPGCSDIAITGNTIENVVNGDCIITIYDTSTILVSNVTVTGNICRNAAGGISVSADTAEGGLFVVSDNLVHNCQFGISVGGSLDEVIVHDNLISGSTSVGIWTSTNGGTTGKLRSYRGNVITNSALDYQGTANGTSVIVPDRSAVVPVSAASVGTTVTVPLMRLGHYSWGLLKFQARRIGLASTRVDAIFRIRWNGTTLVTHQMMSRTSGTISVTDLRMINGVLNATVNVGAAGLTIECSAQLEGMSSEDATAYTGTVTPTTMTVTGSRGGNAALASLLTVLANGGFITDSTS